MNEHWFLWIIVIAEESFRAVATHWLCQLTNVVFVCAVFTPHAYISCHYSLWTVIKSTSIAIDRSKLLSSATSMTEIDYKGKQSTRSTADAVQCKQSNEKKSQVTRCSLSFCLKLFFFIIQLIAHVHMWAGYLLNARNRTDAILWQNTIHSLNRMISPWKRWVTGNKCNDNRWVHDFMKKKK